MRVLMITADPRFGPGHERYELQRAAVDELVVLYWGKGALWPRLPKNKHFDVVTAQDPFWRGHLAHHLVQLFGGTLNVQVHTDLSEYSGLKKWFAKFNLRNADTVRVVSQKIKQQVEAMGVRAKITVLPVYIDVDRFRTVVRHPHDQQTILWIGRFEDEKYPLLALDIVSKIPGAHVIMLGKGSLEGALRKKAHGLSVEFPGWKDPIEYLPRVDVVLSTSKHESYGASIIEALAAGVPVVAPDVGIAKEAGAFVVARQDLAKKVTEVLHDGVKGELKLDLPNKEVWQQRWRESLV